MAFFRHLGVLCVVEIVTAAMVQRVSVRHRANFVAIGQTFVEMLRYGNSAVSKMAGGWIDGSMDGH